MASVLEEKEAIRDVLSAYYIDFKKVPFR